MENLNIKKKVKEQENYFKNKMVTGLRYLFNDRKERRLAKKLINATPQRLMRPYFDNEDTGIAKKVLGDNAKESDIEKCRYLLVVLSRTEYIHYTRFINTKPLYSGEI